MVKSVLLVARSETIEAMLNSGKIRKMN